MIKVKYFLETFFIIVFTLPIALLPQSMAKKIGDFLGILFFHLWSSRRFIALENIKRVFGNENCQKICKETFKNLGKSLVEVIKIYYGFGRKIIENVEIIGIENYYKARFKGRGVIIITGHCGNWELMALSLSRYIDNASIVVRKQKNPYLNKIIERIRAKFGNKVVYKSGALKQILSELRENKTVGILIDQAVLENEGYLINFLGMPAWTSKMPALIARKTQAAVIPVFINRNGNDQVIRIYPEVCLSDINDFERAVIEDTKRFNRYIEDYILSHPTEWLWIHRRWKRA
ncbi:MAG: lysophospholipid acyltransferase family protein [Thermodesulfovibrionales bacterium]|nr:lysophospholipid acyltransferase family protein [Thermodesulfovibrionales bacterium]